MAPNRASRIIATIPSVRFPAVASRHFDQSRDIGQNLDDLDPAAALGFVLRRRSSAGHWSDSFFI
jgi:hypothetical protein